MLLKDKFMNRPVRREIITVVHRFLCKKVKLSIDVNNSFYSRCKSSDRVIKQTLR
jgi:hypothetical protein